MTRTTSTRLDARVVAGMVTIPEVLRHLGWRLRSRKRADCGLCRGSSKGTVAYGDRVWHCHRCHAGGDVYGLVRSVHHCDFSSALRYIAQLAGVRLDYPKQEDDWRTQIANRKRQRERLETAAQKLAALERATWVECRDRIFHPRACAHDAWTLDEQQWRRAQAACVLRDDYALPAYTLLSFAAPAERARYVLHPEAQARMAAAVRWNRTTCSPPIRGAWRCCNERPRAI